MRVGRRGRLPSNDGPLTDEQAHACSGRGDACRGRTCAQSLDAGVPRRAGRDLERGACRQARRHRPSTAYDTRRRNREFLRKWREALCEGYDNLEMELLGRLREGEIKPATGAKKGVRTFDNAIAFRLLAVHRETIEGERARQANVSAAEVRASIEKKVAALRAQVIARSEAERAAAETAPGAPGDDA